MSHQRQSQNEDQFCSSVASKKMKTAEGSGDVDCQSETKRQDVDDDLERQHFTRIVSSFKYYKTYATGRVDRAQRNYNALPRQHQDLLPDFTSHLDQIRHCIAHNAEVIKLILESTECMFENKDAHINGDDTQPKAVINLDMEKVVTTLKQFFRDWSSGGKEEREGCYTPIIEEIQQLYPKNACNPEDISVLVPGAGMGRLAFEIASRGYQCQGNEFSLFMLIASHFVLNRSIEINMFTLYPWILQFSNNKTPANQIRPVQFPDVNPTLLSPEAQFSMVAGDFLEVYTEEASWDCVATSYFIDTAHNILAYVEKIFHILKPGGHWINLGPLLYHFENMPNEESIELSYEVLRRVVQDMGFILKKENTSMRSSYIQDPESMMRYSYNCVFFVCQKPASVSSPLPMQRIQEQF